MIVKTQIISQPYSGEYPETIFDKPSPWNSQSWAWVKFENEDLTEWVGSFRGYPRAAETSRKMGQTIVLTSDYIYRIDNGTHDLIELDDTPQYHSLTVAPDGTFILADYYNIERLEDSTA